jgi:pyruvate,water dikinase
MIFNPLHFFLDLSFFEAQKAGEDELGNLKGIAVGSGKVTAPATVIRCPIDSFKMEAGTTHVCPTTTAVWTAQFVPARGLVAEIGGILSHDPTVTREYGIFQP